MEGFMLGHILCHRNYGKELGKSHCERVLQTTLMGFNMVLRNVKPHYRLVGFDLHGGGGQVGTPNPPWFS